CSSVANHLSPSYCLRRCVTILLPPPSPPLFPYTTLFRSRTAGSLMAQTRALGLSLGDRACLALGLALKAPVYTGALSASPRAKQDRKSTRLNSSHVKISYAVFRLKKKKQSINILFCLVM